MIATILLVEEVTGLSALFDVLILGVALAVAAVPEGLPAVVTAVLSLGVQRMARRNAIVRHLAAVETLGSATVIASDKTGTLTKNEMTVRAVVTASGRIGFGGTGYEPRGDVWRDGGGAIDGALRVELVRALSAADRANNAVLQERAGRWSVQGDPTEGALIVAARKAGLDDEALDARFVRVAEVPFSSERKLMSTVHTDAERQERLLALTKGAPDVLLARCGEELVGEATRPLTPERRAEILRTNDELAGEALRTLGVAFRSIPKGGVRDGELDDRIERGLVFLGLIGMIDPPRQEAKEAVARAKRAGIRPIMITGDHPRTAAVIAAELGVATDRVVTGTELERMPETALDGTVREVSVYARVNPEHKLRIVKALQRQGATVAMTGDGVNDAPALKTADIGVAMGIAGTDVSKEAADMVLADDNFASIVAAVEEGRAIFANIRKFLRYLLSSNLGEVMTMFFGVLLADLIGLRAQEGGLVLPLLATHILWINLVSDGAPALALGMDPADAGVMRERPRARGEGAITGPMWAGIVFVGVIMAVGTLLVLDASLPGWAHRRLGHHAVRTDDGVHHAAVLLPLHGVQRSLRRAQRVPGPFLQRMAVGGRPAVTRAAGGSDLHPVPPAGILDRELERGRLAAVRGGWQFGAVVARAEQGRDAGVHGILIGRSFSLSSSSGGSTCTHRAGSRHQSPRQPCSRWRGPGGGRPDPQPGGVLSAGRDRRVLRRPTRARGAVETRLPVLLSGAPQVRRHRPHHLERVLERPVPESGLVPSAGGGDDLLRGGRTPRVRLPATRA